MKHILQYRTFEAAKPRVESHYNLKMLDMLMTTKHKNLLVITKNDPKLFVELADEHGYNVYELNKMDTYQCETLKDKMSIDNSKNLFLTSPDETVQVAIVDRCHTPLRIDLPVESQKLLDVNDDTGVFESVSIEDRCYKLVNTHSFLKAVCKNCKTESDVLDKVERYIEKYDLPLIVSITKYNNKTKNNSGTFIPLSSLTGLKSDNDIRFKNAKPWERSKKLKKTNSKMGVFESVVSRKKDAQIFNYRSVVEDEWRKLMSKAQKFQKISFSTENDEEIEKKTIFVKKNLRKDQPVKNQFDCELRVAAGDWEKLVMYFRVQFTHQYGLTDVKYEKDPQYVFDEKKFDEKYRSKLSNCHVFIVPQEAGNPLVKTDKGYAAYDDDSLHKAGLKDNDVKLDKESYKKAWKWLDEMLNELVEKRHEMLDDPKPSQLAQAEPMEKKESK